MKKSLVLLFFLVFISCFYVEAQTVKSIGLNSGVLWSTQKWDYKDMDVGDFAEYRTGFHIGLNAEFLEDEYMSVLAELGYAQKGFKTDWDFTTANSPEGGLGTNEVNYTYKYIYFSPLFKVRKEFDNFIPYVFIGPRLDYQMEYPEEFSGTGYEGNYIDIILGLTYGLGLEYMFGQFGACLIFQQQYDITDLYNRKASVNDNTGLTIKNNAFILDLGVKYYFGK